MKTEIFLSQVAKLLEINRHDLKLDCPLEKYGNWDSLTVISTLASIDQHFGVLVKGCEIEQCKTLNDIFSLIESRGQKSVAT